jgi:hypothetical protein
MKQWKVITFTGDVFYTEAISMIQALQNLDLTIKQVAEAGLVEYFEEAAE